MAKIQVFVQNFVEAIPQIFRQPFMGKQKLFSKPKLKLIFEVKWLKLIFEAKWLKLNEIFIKIMACIEN